MCIIKTPEEEFINNLEGYLDLKFEEKDINRIKGYLDKYKESLPEKRVTVPTKVIHRDRVVYRQLNTKDIQPVKEIIIDAVKPTQILEIISQATGISIKKITGKDRYADIILARNVAMYVMRDLCGDTLAGIGKIFNRDHTTVIHSLSHVMGMIEVGSEKYIKLIGYVNFHLPKEEKATA